MTLIFVVVLALTSEPPPVEPPPARPEAHEGAASSAAPAVPDPGLAGGFVLDPPPEALRQRSPTLGLALGGLVGFGSGYYYAGEATRGLIYSIIDGALLAALVGTSLTLNQLVIEHDFRSGKSLARGERDFGRREANLYVVSAGLGALLAGSHIFQAWGGWQAAERTNALLDSVKLVPSGAGAMVVVSF